MFHIGYVVVFDISGDSLNRRHPIVFCKVNNKDNAVNMTVFIVLTKVVFIIHYTFQPIGGPRQTWVYEGMVVKQLEFSFL